VWRGGEGYNAPWKRAFLDQTPELFWFGAELLQVRKDLFRVRPEHFYFGNELLQVGEELFQGGQELLQIGEELFQVRKELSCPGKELFQVGKGLDFLARRVERGSRGRPPVPALLPSGVTFPRLATLSTDGARRWLE
jgi:hypothetical protein